MTSNVPKSASNGQPCAVLLYSQLLLRLGVPHAFTTRRGGVSSGMFDSLNFGNPGDLSVERRDPRANIERNWLLLKMGIADVMSPKDDDAELRAREIVEVHQIHGPAVCVVRRNEPTPRESVGHDVKADAIVTDDPARLAAVRVADCTPVLVASGDGRIVAAIHAGWRGVVGGVVPAAVQRMNELGASGEGMVAAIGPCIGADAFEVGPEVVAEFRRVFGGETPHVRPLTGGGGQKATIDLKGAIREQLLGLGLSGDRVDVLPHCTVRDGAEFFSHRREQGLTGRMVGIIGPRATVLGS